MSDQEHTIANPVSFIETYVTAAIVFLLPIFVLPIFPNIFDTPKIAIMVFLLLFLVFIKALKIIQRGRVEITTGSYDLPLILLAILYIVGALTRTPNRMEALFLPGTTTFVVSGVVLYFVINQLNEAQRNVVKLALVASGAVFSFISLMAIAGLFGAESFPQAMRQNYFNTLGGPLIGIMFLLVSLPFALFSALKSNSTVVKVLASIAAVLIVFGLIINIINTLPGRPGSPRLVDFGTSWSVAVDSLKENPLFGVGPANYLTAFNRFRPASFNLSDMWTLRFSTGRSYFLTMFTEGGMLVLGALILISLKLIRDTLSHVRSINASNWTEIKPSMVSIWVLILLMLLFPATLPILVILFVLLALISTQQKMSFNLTTQGEQNDSFATRFPAILVSLPLIFGALAIGFYGTRYVAAENIYYRALTALSRNEGATSYDLLRSAIQTNPYVDRYHGTYTQVNLALANALAGKDDVTDEDRQTISQLIQQSIREGKATVSLNPTRAGNWELLASTYRAVIPLARGADQFSVQTYNQAIALDPLNTNYRIALGGILFAAEQYDAAIDIFKLAVLTKPDFANAHYNLAMAYKEAGKNDLAIQQMNLVLTLVDRGSQDYEVAKSKLEEWEQGLKAETQDGDELTAPGSDITDPALEPQIELPEDAQPPAAPEVGEEEEAGDNQPQSPSPSPTASPTASPSPSASQTPLP